MTDESKKEMMKNIAQRHQFILERLKEKGWVGVEEISRELNVSEVTVRKDLKYLESKKYLFRNHGGASDLNTIITDKHIDIKEKQHREEKERIAKEANKLLNPDDKVIIASGTTLLAFANEIRVQDSLTVITSSVKVSLALCYDPHIEVIQLGGNIRKNSVSVIGHYATNILESVSCNKLFIGVDGLDFDYGLTTSTLDEALINQQMIDAAQEIIVLTDSSKFGKRGFCKICGINKVHRIITDKNVSKHIVDMLSEQGIIVTVV